LVQKSRQEMLPSMRRYRIEYWVRCSLKSYDQKPFRFSLQGSEVELRLPGSEDQIEGFVAAIELTCSALSEAELDSHDLLTQVLGFISLEFKMPALIENAVRSQVEESGETRNCAIYSSGRRPRLFFLMQQQADEIQRLLGAELSPDLVAALYWLRWSYQAERVPGAFLFAWMALDGLWVTRIAKRYAVSAANPLSVQSTVLIHTVVSHGVRS
jgi:hypothetical protein